MRLHRSVNVGYNTRAMANTALIDTAKASPRIASIDLLKLFAIATVLLGHSVEQLACYGVVCLLRRSRITRALFLGERNRN